MAGAVAQAAHRGSQAAQRRSVVALPAARRWPALPPHRWPEQRGSPPGFRTAAALHVSAGSRQVALEPGPWTTGLIVAIKKGLTFSGWRAWDQHLDWCTEDQ